MQVQNKHLHQEQQTVVTQGEAHSGYCATEVPHNSEVSVAALFVCTNGYRWCGVVMVIRLVSWYYIIPE